MSWKSVLEIKCTKQWCQDWHSSLSDSVVSLLVPSSEAEGWSWMFAVSWFITFLWPGLCSETLRGSYSAHIEVVGIFSFIGSWVALVRKPWANVKTCAPSPSLKLPAFYIRSDWEMSVTLGLQVKALWNPKNLKEKERGWVVGEEQGCLIAKQTAPGH